MSKKRVTKQVDLVRLSVWMAGNKELISGRDTTYIIEQALAALSYRYPETSVRNVAEALGIGLMHRRVIVNNDEIGAIKIAMAGLIVRFDELEKRLEPLLS